MVYKHHFSTVKKKIIIISNFDLLKKGPSRCQESSYLHKIEFLESLIG